MKPGYIILLIFLLIVISGVSGWLIHRPKPCNPIVITQTISDPKIKHENDSIKVVVAVKESNIDSLKRLLSRYGIKPKLAEPVKPIFLSCDTGMIVQQLQEDVRIWQEISINQDSIIKPLQRHEIKLINEVMKRDSAIFVLQTKYNFDVADLKRQRKYIFITVSSIIAAILLLK